MRVLIDGMDLSGKSSLACALVEQLKADGIVACRSVGGLHKGRVDALAQRVYRRSPPGSRAVTWAFVAVVVVDVVFGRRSRGIVVHEAHAAHTVAFARGFGARVAPRLLAGLRPLWPRFDLVISLRARADTRRARFSARAANDAIDAMLFTDPGRFASIDADLGALLESQRALVISTDEVDVRGIAAWVRAVVELRRLQPSSFRARVLRPISSRRAASVRLPPQASTARRQ